MGCDDHHPVTGREFADQPQHLLDLNEVQVRGGFVGQYQGRIERDRPRDRHPLLLPAAQIAGRWVIRSSRPTRASSCPAFLCAARRDMPAASNGTITFSIAVRLGTRLNA